MTQPERDDQVFINCPFDDDYRPLFRSLVFAVQDCGFVARCALEIDDAAQVRIDKILRIIAECRLGVHDISRTELDPASGLPRFNMPLELGLFLGARSFGRGVQRKKVALVFDREPYRYQKYCSDIAGQDIWAHRGSVVEAVKIVRNWLRNASGRRLPGGARIAERHGLFAVSLPTLCDLAQLDPDDLIFNDFVKLVTEWLKAHPW